MSVIKSQRKNSTPALWSRKTGKSSHYINKGRFCKSMTPLKPLSHSFFLFHRSFFFPSSSSFLSEPEFKDSNAMRDLVSLQFCWTHSTFPSTNYILYNHFLCFFSSQIFRKLIFGSFGSVSFSLWHLQTKENVTLFVKLLH